MIGRFLRCCRVVVLEVPVEREGGFTQTNTVECEIELSFKGDAASNHLIDKTKQN